MHFYMIIGKSKLYIYHTDNGKLEPEYIDGNPFWSYNQHTIKEDLFNFLDAIADGNNLEGTTDIEFSIVLSADRVRNVNILNALGEQVKENIPLEDILIRVINKLSEDKSLHIDDFGINYDGESYFLYNGRLDKGPYSLLSYTIGQEVFSASVIER